MKREQDIREVLIGNTIRLVAQGGFERATTRAITYGGQDLSTVKMNEVYIYRLFGSKEQLYEAAFRRVDQEIAFSLREYIGVIALPKGSMDEIMKPLFLRIWRYILDNELRFRYYTRYYCSVYCKGASHEAHNENFKEITAAFAPLFRDDADVGAIMHSVYAAMLGLAVRVYNGDMPDTAETAGRIYNILYRMVQSSLKDEQG